MAPTLEEIPNELLERIIQLLDRRDIFNLRSSSRLLASKAMQRRFKSFFRTKHVQLDERSLKDFVRVTQSGGVGCLVENLILVGLVTDQAFAEEPVRNPATSGIAAQDANNKLYWRQRFDALITRRDALRTLRDSKDDLRLLSEALRNISQSATAHCLSSLSLKIRVYWHHGRRHEVPALHSHEPDFDDSISCGADFGLIYEAAAHTFRITMESLASSLLAVEKLDIYNGSDMQRCSLPDRELNNVGANYPGLHACFAPMESLTMSLCNPRPPEVKHCEWAGERPFWLEGGITPVTPDLSESLGLGQLLKLTQHLSHLNLHYFTQHSWDPTEKLHSQVLTQYAATCSPLPKLRSCRISGLHCDPDELIIFLQQTKPKRIALENIFALSKTWRPIFDLLTSPQAELESLYLDDLFEGHRHICFDAPGPAKYDETGTTGCNTVQRRSETVRLPINYHLVRCDVRHTESLWYWRERRSLEYGLGRF